MKPKIFIDGGHGTTGLQIQSRLQERQDIELLLLNEDERRDQAARKAMLEAAHIAILCLPDDAAREAVALGGGKTRFIDASTAHRTDKAWVYGFAEWEPGHEEKIAQARYVSNPGCYSTGAIALLHPLVKSGVLPPDFPVTINAVSGYSGGGKQLIAQMETDGPERIDANHFIYGLNLSHKHVPEIMVQSGLSRRPLFSPSVGRFAQGMLVQIPLQLGILPEAPEPGHIHEVLSLHYDGREFVTVVGLEDSQSMVRLEPEGLNGTNRMELYVFGSQDGAQVNLVARLDNLGKGASGAAVQNLDLMLASP